MKGIKDIVVRTQSSIITSRHYRGSNYFCTMFTSISQLLLLFSLTQEAQGGTWTSRGGAAFTFHASPQKKSFSILSRLQSSNYGQDFDSSNLERSDERDSSRRSFMKSASLSFAGVVTSGPLATLLRLTQAGVPSATSTLDSSYVANALGLVTFPCPQGSLMNTYHLMRAGQSLLEEKNILSTNPLFL
jgi:hypothetical protein